MLFDRPRSELPIATLRPSVLGRRTILVDLAGWLAHRQAWLRPRAVPLLAALVGLFVTLGAVKAIGLWSHREPLRLAVHATQLDREPARSLTDDAMRAQLPAHRGPAPVRMLLRPLAPSDRYIELTIGTLDPR